ncbi:MAG TPA: family 1 glycosylhydrolase, partial [Azospirillaceae bacterium]|nr:family 1 glycosylhydrolase [Azospirillaceae bacterium]
MSYQKHVPTLDLWAGVECTVNRVGDEYIDQTVLNGHQTRIEDLELFASLGIKAIRYPVLWERVAPTHPDECDWRWTDERLARLRDLGVRPIIGLVHHGSGPRYTNLADPGFASGLAAFAAKVAARYPWVTDFTPVNEPLTTARFSGLYGHWYPHGRNSHTFLRCLINQLDGVRQAMRAIRETTPEARLIQTDDLGKTHGTPALKHQCDFENERRWLGFDLLTGMVDENHPLWEFLCRGGAGHSLESFAADPCPPDLVGINHYLSSERFLDERLDRYPPHTHGGNGRDTYADVEALRVLVEGAAGPEQLLREAWDRYGLPIAVTEVHNGCSREEQLRWFVEVWDVATRLRQEGIDLRAITAWSLL